MRNCNVLAALSALVLTFTLAACSPTGTDNSSDASVAFHVLLDEHWAMANTEKVFFRTDPDTYRMDGKLSEHSPEARARRQQYNESVLERLAGIDIDELDADDQMSFRIFKYERETERESYEQRGHFFPITSMFGYHTYFADAPSNMSFLAAGDYDDYLVSLADFTRYNREYIGAMRGGIAAGYTHYCDSISGVAATIEDHIVAEAEQSRLYVPFARFPGIVSDDQRAEYTSKGVELINTIVVPGYEELLDFFVNEYLPACREEVAITSLPGGEDYYQYLIRYFTTTDMTAAEIHELGVAELSRIRSEMRDVMTTVGFEGGLEW